MSQVIHNHVLRVGQTVCVSSQEESKSLHLAGYPGCSALPMKCTYYSTESWADPPTMVHTTARLLPSAGLYEAHPVFERVAAHTQGKGQQEGPTAPPQPKEEDAVPETHLESPTLDISIESLNQLILEIDPTFQPLTCKPVRDAVQPASRGDAAATDKQDPEGIGEARGAGRVGEPAQLRPGENPLQEAEESPGWRGWSHQPQQGEVLSAPVVALVTVTNPPSCWDQCGVLCLEQNSLGIQALTRLLKWPQSGHFWNISCPANSTGSTREGREWSLIRPHVCFPVLGENIYH